MIALMVIPPAVLILPLFVLMVNISLINTLTSVIIIYSGLLIPFSIYLLVSFFRSLPSELFDAAAIDGCTNLDTFWRITLPLSTPALVTLVVVNALFVWNELLIALVFLQSEDDEDAHARSDNLQRAFYTQRAADHGWHVDRDHPNDLALSLRPEAVCGRPGSRSGEII